MSAEPDLLQAMAKVEAILAQSKLNTDRDIWFVACAMVAIAGKRANDTNQPEIERACTDFVEAMHEHAGTPPLKETEQ